MVIHVDLDLLKYLRGDQDLEVYPQISVLYSSPPNFCCGISYDRSYIDLSQFYQTF